MLVEPRSISEPREPPAAPLAAGESAHGRFGDRGLVFLLAALMLFALASELGDVLNHDVAWYVHSAMAFLDGGRLYEDVFFEVNPPLMLYLTVPGAALARLTGLFSAHAFVLTVFAIITFALWLSWRVLSGAPGRCRHLGIVFAFVVLAVLPAGDFGQREHFLVCLALPYLFLVARCLHDREPCPGLLTVLVGASAGIGFAIKPHYLLVPAALELVMLWRTRCLSRMLRPETLSLAAVVCLYIAAILVFTPAYLTRVVPYALEVYEAGRRNDFALVLVQPEALLLVAVSLGHWRLRRALMPWQTCLADVFVVSAIALFGAYLWQMKGWTYHLYPTTAMLILLAGTVIGASSVILRPAQIFAFAVTLVLVTRTLVAADHRYVWMDRLMPYIQAHGAEAIHVFGPTVSMGFPLALYAEVEWASRFPSLWLVAGAEQRRRAMAPGAELGILDRIERFTTDAVIADLAARQPELVFVDARPRKPFFGDIEFDYIEHFSADPRFAELWGRYEQIGKDDGFEVYRLRPEVPEPTTASRRPPRSRTS